MKNQKTQFTVGSLFAGIGGICRGFMDAGFNVLWANEFDKFACETYRANFSHRLLEEDIRNVDPDDLPKVDIITSGFPCQAFSIAGYQKGFSDLRGDLFFETMRLVDAIKPKAILLENVKNLESHDNGKTISIIKEAVKANGYSYIAKVLNSMEYGNIPQNRERIYIVGFRDEADYWGDIDNEHICSSTFEFPEPMPLTKKVQDFWEKGRVDKKYYYNDSKYYEEFKKTNWRKDTVYQWRRIYLRENKSNVCPTLTANMGTGGHNVPLIKDDFDIRKLTPRECAHLQGFTDEFLFPSDMSNARLYKQVGNSVTVPVVKRIAKNIHKALVKKYATETAREIKLE